MNVSLSLRPRSPRPRRARGARAGLTLLEIMVTSSLLVLIVVPVYGLFFRSRQAVAEARYYAVARLAIEHQIERMRTAANEDEARFGRLAQFLTDAPTFTVPGLPRWVGGAANGRIRVCLDETQQFFADTAAAHDDYFSRAPFTQVPSPSYQVDLDASGGAFTALTPAALYRVLPVRVEVFWGPDGLTATDARDMAPKVAIHAVIAPKTGFRRG